LAYTYLIISWRCCFFIIMNVALLPITIRYTTYEYINCVFLLKDVADVGSEFIRSADTILSVGPECQIASKYISYFRRCTATKSGGIRYILFDVCRSVHRNYFYSKTNQMHNISNLFYFGTTLYMIRTVFPSIIRSLRPYIQQQVYVIQILLAAC
jgi:hypothetical protein